MWGRVIEMLTAVWLSFSPYIFHASATNDVVWGDTIIALVITIFSGLSFWRPTQYAYLAILGVAVGLITWGRFATTPTTPAHQNHIVVGLFLLMIAIIPNHASRPPAVWRTPVEDC